jgi:hypothetical protein
MHINILKKMNNNKFSNIIEINNHFYIFGIESININTLNKFILFYDIYTIDFKFIKKIKINYNFKESSLIWDIYEYNNNEYVFLIEQKSIDLINHRCKFYKYYINKENIQDFKINKIEKIKLEDHLISKIYNNYLLTSKIEIDEERPTYYWGKYLFYFQDENKIFYKPIFDNIVNYEKDKGHILHYIETLKKNNDEKIYKKYFIVFSIRHKYEHEPIKYYYKIYSAYSDDLKYFYNTKEIQIEDNISDSKWYCYPEISKKENKYYILMCQDDFGKEKESLLGELIMN